MSDICEFNTLPTDARDRLNRLSALVAGVTPMETKSWKFGISRLKTSAETPNVVLEVARWAGKDNVLLYTLCLATECDISELRTAFSDAKANRYGRAFPRLNGFQSRCLYVGSSKNMHQRLREHLGYGAKGTYALHLAHWATRFSVELELTCAKYQAGINPEVYQVLEDTLWDKMRPMFGRRGAK